MVRWQQAPGVMLKGVSARCSSHGTRQDCSNARPQAIGAIDPIWDLGEEDDDDEDDVAAATAKRAAGWDIPDVLWDVRPYTGRPAGVCASWLTNGLQFANVVAARQGPAVPALDTLVIGVGGVGAATLHLAYSADAEAVASLRTPKRPVWDGTT